MKKRTITRPGSENFATRRYDIRVTNALYARIKTLGEVERRKFRTHVRLNLPKLLDEWVRNNPGPSFTITP